MQLPILFYFSLMWILLSQAKDDGWILNVNQTINVTKGSNITILCTFDVPLKEKTEDYGVYWKTPGKSDCSKNDRDTFAFAFHPNSSCVHSNFRNRTKLIGEKNNGSCSLQILNIGNVEPNIYLRVAGKNDYYSFNKKAVTIYVDDSSDPSFENATKNEKIKLYLATLLPVLGLLFMAAAGTVAWKIHKRSHLLKREESGYYANFRRTSSTPPKSELFCKTSNNMLPEPKVIDEPVYLNFQTPANLTDQQAESIDNVYGNVDFST